MESALATQSDQGAALAEQVVLKGDLSRLTEQQRMDYYSAVCRSLGLNPLTRPFEYITLNGKLTLYATRGAADQLRSLRGITITNLDPRQVGDLLVVVATGRDASGREDSSTGAVSTAGLRGEALANAMMKAETKAKRRLTLSLAGLGWSDETEVASIASAVRADVDPLTGEIKPPKSLADKIAEKAAQVTPRDQIEAAVDEKADEIADDAQWREAFDAVTSVAMTGQEFLRRTKAAKIDGTVIRAAAHKLFGEQKSGDLTDAQWGRLAAEVGVA